VTDLLKPDDATPFRPTESQALAKARFDQWAAEYRGVVPLANIQVADLERVCLTTQLGKWLRDQDFAAWFFNQTAFMLAGQAMKHTALDVLQDLVLDPQVAPRDRLRAVDMVLKLAGAYPDPAASRVRFLDAALNDMDEAEVARQLAALRSNKPLDKT
jgi:hypothetical protein